MWFFALCILFGFFAIGLAIALYDIAFEKTPITPFLYVAYSGEMDLWPAALQASRPEPFLGDGRAPGWREEEAKR